ncbi:MAG: TIGR03792 family protein [Cyanobacteria bacterium P01_H01_bin.121]
MLLFKSPSQPRFKSQLRTRLKSRCSLAWRLGIWQRLTLAIAIGCFAWVISPASAVQAVPVSVVEWLQVEVPLAEQAAYLEAETAIWTGSLKDFPGFEGKEIWQDPQQPDSLTVVIHWRSQADWDAIPGAVVEAAEQAFSDRLGKEYSLTVTTKYAVLDQFSASQAAIDN